jgi:hypothetical protein
MDAARVQSRDGSGRVAACCEKDVVAEPALTEGLVLLDLEFVEWSPA